MTMERYFVEVYTRRHRLCARTLPAMRYAARRFDAFAKQRRSLNEATFTRFRKWLANAGYGDASYWRMAKVIARDRNPRGPWAQPPSFLERETPGTLDHCFVTSFAKRSGRAVRDKQTRRRYSGSISLFGEYLGRPAMLTDLASACVNAFLRWIVRRRGLSDWTAANHAQRIGSLWRWAWFSGLVETPPTWRTA